jgi:exonuclease SbcD
MAYRSRFANLYDELLAAAQAEYPDVPVIAMGHMTCVDLTTPTQEGDFSTPIHSFTALFGLPTDIFSKSYHYVALGHIHRCHQVGEREIWYSGSPVPVSVVEARTPRYVLVVTLGEKRTRTRKVPVPRWRDVFEIEGDPLEVNELVRTLMWESKFPPYLYIDVLIEEGQYVDVDRYQNLIARHFEDDNLPRIVRFRSRSNVEVAETADREPARELDEMEPEDVFVQMYLAKYQEPPSERIMATFRELLVEEL